jgi:DHA2 family multidrug resistance protein
MTSLTVPAPLAATSPATTAAPAVFGTRIIIGLVGVLLAVLVSGLNEMVTKVALADIRGALHIGYDEGTWLVASYTATSVAAMAFAPWCSVTFSLRRFTLCAIGLFTLLGVLCPFAPNYESLLLMRILQGLAGGALPPMLMTVALRFLPANIKLYGLAGYALTATFGPGLGTPLAGLWTEYVGWQWTFWQIIVPCLIAMAAVAYGLPQDPLRLERLRAFNWKGLLLGFPAICMLVIGLLQGNRLDWFESNLICGLLGAGSLLLMAFMINEWSQPAVCVDHPRRGVDRAAGGGADSVELSGPGAGLSSGANRADHAHCRATAVDRADAGGSAVQFALGRLPLGARHGSEHARAVLPRRFTPDFGVDSR